MTEPPLHMWLTNPLPKAVEQLLHRLRQTEGIAHIAVMPDVHVAGEFCVGTVVASPAMLFPNAVGGDIGCGMLALQFDQSADILADPDRAARVLGALHEACPSRRHHHRCAPVLPQFLRETALSHPHLESQKNSADIRQQLGTLGAGNHFLEFQSDEHNHLWLMIHTGSRHLGQAVLQHHLPKSRKRSTQILALDADSAAGRDYLHDVQIARAYAQENRRQLALAAARIAEQILHASPIFPTLFDCDHNHVQLETQHGEQFFIHRKGATAAHEADPGIIPGSMATRSYHTIGKGNVDALCSSSHGSGRQLSRAQAREKISASQLRQQLQSIWYDARVAPHLREEAPAAYKKIEDVMQAQSALTAITRTLRPLLVHKGI